MAILGFLVKINTNLILSITFEPFDEIPCVIPFFHSKLNFPSFLFSTRVKIPKNGDFYFFRQNFKKKFLILALEATILAAAFWDRA